MKEKSVWKTFCILKRKNLFIYLFIFFFILLEGCTEPFYIETEDAQPVIVIYGIITDEYKRQSVKVSSSAPYFQEQPAPLISGAEVKILTSEDEVYYLFEEPEYSGTYVSTQAWQAKEGVEYSLEVKTDFNKDGVDELYQASTVILPAVFLDSIKIKPITIMGHKNYSLNIYGQDPPEENYFSFNVSVNGISVTEKITKGIITKDEQFNGLYISGLTLQYFDNISEWEKDSDEDRERSVYLKSGDVITLHTSSISKGYFEFISQCIKEKNGENPMFGGPASNIITNITNGGVGYFSGYCITNTFGVVE